VKALGAELARLVDYTEASLAKVSDADSQVPLRAGGWSRKQVIGHLIDSASNNHQRFVRAALEGRSNFGPRSGRLRPGASRSADGAEGFDRAVGQL